MTENRSELSQFLEILEKRDREHALEMNELRAAIEDLRANIPGGGQNSRNFNNPLQVRNVKLDFPKFDGNDVLQWIF
ncbi:Transposon Ty3-G Gag-Pol polyprotein [Sesbania bispinosa]|nr:Transposon Ty3-G Gag-Pol polyprotein [Sesbania bispinosa]